MNTALVPTRGRRRDGPKQTNPPPPGAPESRPQGRAAHRPPPPPPGCPRGTWVGVTAGTDQQSANQAEPGAQGCQTAPAKHAAGGHMPRHAAGRWGGLRRDPQATPLQLPGNLARGPKGGGGAPWRDPPPLPPLPPPARGMLEAGQGGVGPLTPPPGQGTPPPPPLRGPRDPERSATRPIRHAPARRHPPAPTSDLKRPASRAGAQGHPADRIRGQHADMNRNTMDTTPSMDLATPMTPALVPAKGRQRDGPR